MDTVDSVLQRLRQDLKRGRGGRGCDGKSGKTMVMAMVWATSTEWTTAWKTADGRKKRGA